MKIKLALLLLLTACGDGVPELMPDASLPELPDARLRLEPVELTSYERLDRIVYPETCWKFYELPWCHRMPCPNPERDERICLSEVDPFEGLLWTCACYER